MSPRLTTPLAPYDYSTILEMSELSMDARQTVAALSALAHETRLSIYRMLVQAGLEGLSAGTIATRVKVAPSSLTFHVQHLHRAGLVTQRRVSRQLFYAADFNAMNSLMAYLTENCCGTGENNCHAPCEPVKATRRSKRVTKAA
jgi:ArsR family transcriptional regulator, arsenate/arsenite/antimonite-responsive transcriptional repressor